MRFIATECSYSRGTRRRARNLIETPAGRLENGCKILKDTLCLDQNTSLD